MTQKDMDTTAGRIAALEAKQTATRAALWTCTDPEQGRALRREYDDTTAELTDLYWTAQLEAAQTAKRTALWACTDPGQV